jgi:replicative DNA helicase
LRTQPVPSTYDDAAEKAILCRLIQVPNSLGSIEDTGLHERDFFDIRHRKMFQVLKAEIKKGRRLDESLFETVLRDHRVLEEVGGIQYYLDQVLQSLPLAYNAVEHARVVHEKAILRNLSDLCEHIQTQARLGVSDLVEFLDQAEADFLNATSGRPAKGLVPMHEVLMGAFKSITEAQKLKTEIPGLETGFIDWDRVTTGFRPGQLVIVAARPAMGKTSLFLSIAQNIAQADVGKKPEDQRVVAIFSLEMSSEELIMRLISSLTGIHSKALRQGNLREGEYKKITETLLPFTRTSQLFFDDSGTMTVRDVKSRCRKLKSEKKRLDLIIVDYLQLMDGSSKSRSENSREREISEISRGLKALSKELEVPIIALSQLNRGLESRPDKRPMLSDLRESGAIEQDADMVCFIYRDEVYNKESPEKGVAELILAKHRAGETGTIRLGWQANLTKFFNLDHQHRPEVYPIRPEDRHRR